MKARRQGTQNKEKTAKQPTHGAGENNLDPHDWGGGHGGNRDRARAARALESGLYLHDGSF